MPETITVLEMKRTFLKDEYDKKKKWRMFIGAILNVGLFFSILVDFMGFLLIIVSLTSDQRYLFSTVKLRNNFLIGGSILIVFSLLIYFIIFYKKKLSAQEKYSRAQYDNDTTQLNQDILRQLDVSKQVDNEKRIDKKYMTSDNNHLDTDSEKTCPMCAERVKVAARICRFCRYEF